MTFFSCVQAHSRGVTGILTASALLLAGCSSTDTPGAGSAAGSEDAPRVLTTFTVVEDIAQNVAGEHLVVESLIKPGVEVHEYDPTPSDIRRVHDADVVLNNGLNLEAWFERFTREADVQHVTVSEGVEVIDIAGEPGTPNPHAWMSPSNVQVYVDNIAETFAELDPEHADEFRANADTYKQQLQQVRDDLVQGLERLEPNQRTLVTCEGAFSYLAQDAGLNEAYLWPVNSEEQATPAQVAEVIETVREGKIAAVFCESTVNQDAMRQVAEATGAEFGGTLYVDSLSDEGGQVPTYLDLLKHDAELIRQGLTR
ncbi:metal ABC transporter substrate-binding protein [Rothia sp. ZJ1223]|uniref:metal ABC transporter substrate-binding protein n=1 Tax=Rothia sp. ZJ1223 TaxID=2811098 RepID=UPI00195C2F61|nr:metal ABC transporter substrate-binding protein [Rothia sp. ZJ1223]MBM7051635.1 metal ABC transporter substrate-binding protein [Rothia sp. ZJ1223]